MKVINLRDHSQQELSTWLDENKNLDVKPAVFIGIDKEGEPVLSLGQLTYKELAYIKICLDMHITKDWLDLL